MSAAPHPETVERTEPPAEARPEVQYVVKGPHDIVFQVGVPGVMTAASLNALLAMAYGAGWRMEAWILGGLMWGTLLTVMAALAYMAQASDSSSA